MAEGLRFKAKLEFGHRRSRVAPQLGSESRSASATLEDIEVVKTFDVTADMVYAGVEFKAGDRLVFFPHVYGLDEQMVDDPFRVDFDRPVSSHLVFGSGPHRCVGSHLARLEMRVFLEEWVRRVPKFSVQADGELATRGGLVWSPVRVPLAWGPASPAVQTSSDAA